MKKIGLLGLLILIIACSHFKKEATDNWQLTELQKLPESITNNAVSEGFINERPFVYSFAGLDSSKQYSGIHLRSYKLDVMQNQWERIANLPDTLGKVASAASRIGDTIYIIGGYHVFKDHSELSSNKVHRYDIKKDSFLADGNPIPVAIDDHVQAVWRNHLIYVITGWSDKENVPNVQIYNPQKNSWLLGTPVPNNHVFKSFGASGAILGDTIYYFGGASMGKHYPIQNALRKGVINPNNPSEISWSQRVLDSTIVGYRMAATTVDNQMHWVGGSTRTYNYTPISYKGKEPVSPSNRSLRLVNNELKQYFDKNFSMDLRGIAEINDSTKIIVGGIGQQQEISDNVVKIVWKD